MIIEDLGIIEYTAAEQLQRERLEGVQAGTAPETLFILEHPSVITLGRRGGENNLHVSEEFLREHGISLVHCERGGNITCHYPGQLVAYPIFKLQERQGGVHKLFWCMEETVIRTAAAFGVEAARSEGRPGVWVGGQRKICSIGMGIRQRVTWHGLSLNVKRDTSLFDLITLCGLTGAAATSLERETGIDISMQEVKDVFVREFRTVFADSGLVEGEIA